MNNSADLPPSKSQLKRDAEALRVLGQQLLDLDSQALDALPLTEALREAIAAAKTIKSHGAKKRQMQWIGKKMREADHEAIRAALLDSEANDAGQSAEFHLAEQWRDRLIKEGTQALSEFIDHFHPEDIQGLRQLIKKASSEGAEITVKTAKRALFRLIRATL